MHKGWMIAMGAMLASGVTAAQENAALKTQKERVSYALGMDLGNQLRKRAIDVERTLAEPGRLGRVCSRAFRHQCMALPKAITEAVRFWNL